MNSFCASQTVQTASFVVAFQVIGELTHISGISKKSISDFAHVTLVHIVSSSFPAEQLQF